jgi:small-conductance mechanosensitive channel
MEEIFDRLVTEPLGRFYEKVMEFLPNLVSAVIILLIGFAAGWLTKIFLEKLFRIIKVDLLSERTGFKAVLGKGGLNEPVSRLMARLIGYFIVFFFFLASLNNLEFGIIQDLIDRLLNFLPSVFIALAILLLGYMLGNFIGRAALIAAVNAGIRISGPVSRGVRYLVYLIAVSMALEQLGIGRDTVLVSFGIVFSGVVLAFAIAFGLGGKDVAGEYLEKRLKERKDEDDFRHL